MKTLGVRLAPAASADAAAISWWLDEQGVAARTIRSYLARLRRRYVAIGRLPFGGQARGDYGSGVRTAAFERSATILYRVEPDHVLILRILRAWRDVEAAARS